jgi:hypothetical protein
VIDWPQDVVSDVARRRCVIFLGSGISMNSTNSEGRRPKAWLDLLESIMKPIKPNRHIKKLLKDGDYLTACEIIKRNLGREEFTRKIEEEFLEPGYRPAEIHKRIFSLDSRIVATPNFDKIYETYANTEANGSIVVKQHYDSDVISVIRGAGRVILKVHGTIDSPDKLIFTRAEYAKARSQYSHFYEILEALSLTHTFLFLGCGVNDPDIKLLLEDTLFKHNSSRTHLMLLPNNALHISVAEVMQDTMNLKIIRYSPKENHQELHNALDSLLASVENERQKIQESMNW